MKKFLGFLASRWFVTGLVALILAALVWFFGPLLPPLAGLLIRLVLVVVILAVWLAVNLLLDWRRRKRDATLAAGVADAGAATQDKAAAEELAALSNKLKTSLALLRKASGSRAYLYEQPWYVIIGPPGAGKTTALLNAGLKFPLAAELGQGAVAGVGGTRLCDWWFTEQAVLIDTAGRYTTQDSDAATDRAGWEGFLDLLKRTRQRQALNGVIVAISLADIAAAPRQERLAHARAIRKRIKELTARLDLKLPVYALLTKADLIAGFTEFFDDLDQEKRGQVWGVTFPAGEANPASRFADEFRLLTERLDDRLIDNMQRERSPDRRALFVGFPTQVASLEAPLTEFLGEAFGGSALDPAPFLRGVYMTSGTQEGTPVDRLTATMARSFGIDQMRAPSLVPEKGRSYFLSRLLKDMILGESMLVSRDPGAIRRKVLLRAGAAALALIVAIVGTGALLQTRSANLEAVSRANTALAAYTAAAQALPLDPVRDSDLASILPLLDQARALPYGAGGFVPGAQWFPGLSQTGKLQSASQIVYRNALNNILLPRLIVRLESQMRQNFNQPTFLYEATRVYLELGSVGPLDRNLIKQWMHFDWQANFRGPAADDTRTRLETHLAALLEDRLPKVPLDGALVEDAQRTFSRISLADRVYSAIRRSPQAAALPPWRPGDAAGESGVRVFHRRSGQSMTDGIPGFFTVNGFYKVLLPQLPVATRQAASESWVLGRQTEVDPNSPRALSLGTDVIKLYTDDYIRTWDDLLGDIDVEPLGSIQQAVQSLYILSSPQSPMRDLLTGIVHQLMLTVAPPADPAKAAAGGAVAGAANAAGSQLQNLFATNGPAADPPGKVVETHFAPLIAYVGKGPGAPIDAVLKLMNDLQQQLAQLANSAQGAAPPAGGTDPAQLLLAEASRAPEPVRRWVQVVTGAGNTLRSGGAKKGAAEAFNAPGGPASLCKQAVAGRYPFSPSSANDIPLDDFGRLFAPNGLIDQFFTTQLRPFVDTSGTTWHAQAVAGVAPPVSPGDLAQFQRAAAIRDLFFGGGGNQPTVRFDIQPVSVDNGAKQVTLDFDGTTVVYAHGPLRSVSVTWPGPNRMNSARLVFDPPPSSGPPVLQTDGPWALFRLFNQGILQQSGSADRYTLTFNLGDRHAVFEIRAGSVLNPFAPGVLRDFRCPKL